MTQPRKEQIFTLRAYWSSYAYTATGGVSSNSLPGGFQAATVTQTSGGNTSTPTRGIITSGLGGYVNIRYTTNGFGVVDDADSLPMFGRLTYSSGTYTITFKTLVSGSETTTSLPAGSYSLTIIFPEVMNNSEVPADANLVAQIGDAFQGGGGAAGGDLTGNYPNPQLNKITRTSIFVGDGAGVDPFEFVGATVAIETNGSAVGVRGGVGGQALGSNPGGTGGVAYIVGGAGGVGFSTFAAGEGGTVSVTGGLGGDGSLTWLAGAGGGINIQAGDAGANNGAGGAVGGDINIIAGTSTLAGAPAGLVRIRAGSTTNVTGLGGEIHILAGSGSPGGSGDGGLVNITSGDGGLSGGTAGNINIITGNSYSGNASINIGTSTPGDNITIGGSSTNILISGSIQFSGNTIWSSGYPSLPMGGGDNFAIDGIQVGSAVTATNLDTLTNGSNADALHTHSALGFSGTSGEAITIGAPLGFENVAGSPHVFNADANAVGNRHFCAGIAGNSPGAPSLSVSIYSTGERSIADAIWDSVPAVADVGSPAYLSENVGKLTLTPPSTLGSYTQRVGFVTRGGTGTVKMLICIGDSLLN